MPSQRERVLKVLIDRPRYGVTQVDFALPHVCDGGPPITRVAARIEELRNAGHVITRTERRDKCVVYRLVREAAAEPLLAAGPHTREGATDPQPLFDLDDEPRSAIFEDAA